MRSGKMITTVQTADQKNDKSQTPKNGRLPDGMYRSSGSLAW
jgi:hypothetical protein